jgi:hypothetical protein
MKRKFTAETLANEILSILEAHGLKTRAFGISVTIPGQEFDAVAADYPNHQPEMVLIRSGNGIQWYVKITRERSLADFPPGALLRPPND